MAQNQVYLIKSGENSFVEETQAIVGISGGKVGIGTTHPEADLHVTGSVKVGGDLTVDGTLTTINSSTVSVDDKNIELGGTDNPTDVTAEGGGITVKGDTDKTFNWHADGGWTSSENLSVANGKHFAGDELRAIDAGGLRLFDNNASGVTVKSGKVGVHSVSPVYDLDVVGSGNFTSLYVGGNSVLTGTAADLGKWSDGSAGEIYYNGGNVGIATNDPAYTLDVSGSGNFASLYVGGSQVLTSSDGGLGKWTEGSTAGEIYYTGGNVGIATNDPAYTLDVAGGGNFNSLTVQGNNVLTGSAADLGKWEDAETAGEIYYAGGNVGINTNNPSTTLDVNGSLNVEGSFTVLDQFNFGSNGAVGGFAPAAVDDIIKWNGTKWVAGANPGGAGAGGGEVPSALINSLISGQSVQSIAFLDTYDTAPRIATELEIDGEGSIIPYVISGVSTTGYNLIFSQEIPNNNYKIHTVFGGKDVYWETGASNSLAYNDGDVSLQRNLTVGGNLTVNGTQTIVNTETVEIEDHNLVIAANAGHNQLTAEYPGAGGAYAGILWGTGDAGAASPVSLTYQSNKGFAFEGGNVGIGTTSPSASLHVDSSLDGPIFDSGGTGNTNHALLVRDSAKNQLLRVNNNGNVGIGTTTPGATLHIRANDNSENALALWVVNESHQNSIISAYENGDVALGSFTYRDATGNVGIGTTDPNRKLEVVGDSGLAIADFKSDSHQADSFLYITNTATPVAAEVGSSATLSLSLHNQVGAKISAISTSDYTTNGNSNCALGFSVALNNLATERMRIAANGNVGIGTTNPSKQLHIQGTNASTPGIKISASDQGYEHEVRANGDGVLISADTTNYGGAGPDIRFSVSGSERMRIRKNGRVGIGTANPDATLHISSPQPVIRLTDTTPTADTVSQVWADSDATGALFLASDITNAGTDPFISFRIGGTGQANEGMRIKGDGNVGIGTTSPTNGKLEIHNPTTTVATTDSVDLAIIQNASGTSSKVQLRAGVTSGDDPYFSIRTRNRNDASSEPGVIKERMRITHTGNVGIGTTSPSSFTGFMGAGALTTTIASSIGTVLNLQRGTDTDKAGIGALQFVNTNNSSATGMGSGSQLLGLISIQNVTSDLNAGSDAGGNLRFYTKQEAGSCEERMRIAANGNVGIGTTGPNNKLQIISDSATQTMFLSRPSGSVCTMNRDTTDGHILRFEKNGVLVGHISTNSNGLPSDRNFKRNITDLKLGLDFVNKLKPSVYNYKIDDENCPVHYGLIAQDVESALEECGVEKNSSLMLQHSPTEKEEESDYSLDYGKLVPVLTKAIQEQQQIIEDLQSQNASLESRISALES